MAGKLFDNPSKNAPVSAIFENGKAWISNGSIIPQGTPDAVYQGGKIWKGYYPQGIPDAVYQDGKIWRGYYPQGIPDAVYQDGKVWMGYSPQGIPDATYDGADDGAAAAFALLFLL